MAGGTTFHFIEAAPSEALDTARAAADGQDVRIGGGPSMVRDFLAAGLVDHMHVVQVPILLGRGVGFWDGLEALEESYDIETVSSPSGDARVRRPPTRALPELIPQRYHSGMSHQIAIRIPDDLLAFVDDLVDRGSTSSRASFAREAMERERRRLLAEADIAILRTSAPNDDLDTITRAVSGTSLDVP